MIKIENLNHVYQSGTPFERHALKNINLDIKEGSFTGIIGHTGSGKSTLIQHFNAIVKPTSGKIFVDGDDIFASKENIRNVRRKVGLVFQYPEHQLFEETVYKDIAFGPTNLGLSGQEIKERVYEAIAMVGIKESKLEVSPFELSGGQKRRVAIAGIIAMKPKVLILDEPTAGLDPKGREEILAQIKQMHNSLGLTVILVSHSMEDIAATVQNVIVMNKGEIALEGNVAEVFSHSEELIKMGLNVPQINQIIAKLRENGVDIPKDIYTVKRAKEVLAQIMMDKM